MREVLRRRCYVEGVEGVKNAVVVDEESCVLDVKRVLIISSGRVLVLNCSLKSKYSRIHETNCKS